MDDRRALVARGAIELFGSADDGIDEVFGDERHRRYCDGRELGIDARSIQMGLCVLESTRRIHRRPIWKANDNRMQSLFMVGRDMVDWQCDDLSRTSLDTHADGGERSVLYSSGARIDH